MTCLPNRPAIALLAAAAALVAVPESAAQNRRNVPDAPLEFDPARPERVDGWWTNGTELMRLDASGAYRLWVSADRFKRPVEIGAWRRTNYVYFDLEPYRAKPGTRFRVDLQKEDGVTELRREGMADFRWVPSPPHVAADDMLGAWVAATERLLVLENGRYEWRRTGPATGITEHAGIWNSDGDLLILAPDTPALENVTLRLAKDASGGFVLEGRGGRMVHPPTAPAPSDPAPAAAPGPAAPPAPQGPPATPAPPVVPRQAASPPASGDRPPANP